MANHVSHEFAQYKDDRLVTFADGVFTGISGHATTFTNVPASATMAMLGTAKADFETKRLAAIKGSVAQTEAKKAARADLLVLLRILASYVEGVALGDADIIRLAGFEVVSHQHNSQSQLARPDIKLIANEISTQLKLRVNSVPNAHAYEVQWRIGSGAWVSAGAFPDPRSMVITGLTPGTTYELRVRAVGGSTGYSDWSDPVSHMCM